MGIVIQKEAIGHYHCCQKSLAKKLGIQKEAIGHYCRHLEGLAN